MATEDNSGKRDYEEYLAYLESTLNSDKAPARRKSSVSAAEKAAERRKAVRRVLFIRAAALAVAVCLIAVIILSVRSCKSDNNGADGEASETEESVAQVEQEEKRDYFAKTDPDTVAVDDSINSKAVVFIDLEGNRVIAGRNMYERMYPASTTKIMTLLVAAENLSDLSATFKMTYQITDPLYRERATVAGFLAGEVITAKDLIYGTILPSGGDAAIGLAQMIAGSEEEFVALMNKKAAELGLKSTRFSNCTGLFDKEHYTTAYDLSVILRAAMDDPLCKTVLSTQKYTTSSTDKHPEGLELENTLFKYMYGTEPETAVITGGKTGYVNESGYCIASFGAGAGGEEYVCVTLRADTRWPAVYDQINLYKAYAKKENKQ